jgi:hypothetical protein
VSKSGLHKHYDRLDADERFRLDVLAMAREDSRESERLVASCPRFSYTMNDMGFVGRWQGAIEITLRVCIPLEEQLAKLQTVDALRVFVPYSQTLLCDAAFDAYYKGHESGSRHAWACAGKTGSPPAWPDAGLDGELVEPDEEERDAAAMERDTDDLEVMAGQYNKFFPDLLDELERRCVTQAFSIWSGYAAFCEENAGVSAEKLAAVVLAPLLEQIEDMNARAERLYLEPEAKIVEEIREGLAESWRVIEERGV